MTIKLERFETPETQIHLHDSPSVPTIAGWQIGVAAFDTSFGELQAVSQFVNAIVHQTTTIQAAQHFSARYWDDEANEAYTLKLWYSDKQTPSYEIQMLRGSAKCNDLRMFAALLLQVSDEIERRQAPPDITQIDKPPRGGFHEPLDTITPIGWGTRAARAHQELAALGVKWDVQPMPYLGIRKGVLDLPDLGLKAEVFDQGILSYWTIGGDEGGEDCASFEVGVIAATERIVEIVNDRAKAVEAELADGAEAEQ